MVLKLQYQAWLLGRRQIRTILQRTEQVVRLLRVVGRAEEVHRRLTQATLRIRTGGLRLQAIANCHRSTAVAVQL